MRCRFLRIGVTLVAVWAVLGLPVVPTAHAHTSLSGKAFVHSHVIGDPAAHDGALDHGDHHRAPTFVQTFTIARTQPLDVPIALATMVPAPPEMPVIGRVQAFDARLIHGPPLRVRSLRAPPASTLAG